MSALELAEQCAAYALAIMARDQRIENLLGLLRLEAEDAARWRWATLDIGGRGVYVVDAAHEELCGVDADIACDATRRASEYRHE